MSEPRDRVRAFARLWRERGRDDLVPCVSPERLVALSVDLLAFLDEVDAMEAELERLREVERVSKWIADTMHPGMTFTVTSLDGSKPPRELVLVNVKNSIRIRSMFKGRRW